jgi:hypothetical protein
MKSSTRGRGRRARACVEEKEKTRTSIDSVPWPLNICRCEVYTAHWHVMSSCMYRSHVAIVAVGFALP